MAMAHRPEVYLRQEELLATTKSESPWLNELLQRDVPFIDAFKRQQLYTSDSISSNFNDLDFNDLFGLERNHSDLKHLYSMSALFSAGQTENNIKSQKCRTEDKFLSQRCQSDAECSVSSYMNLEAAALSGNDASRMLLPTREQGALEGEASRRRSEDIPYGKLHFPSSVNPFKKSTGVCTAPLVDAHCNRLSEVEIAHNGTDQRGALLEVPTLTGIGGLKKGKKRSRASRRPPTTVLEADSANFRSMVQQLTGIHSSSLPSNSLPRRGSDFSNFNFGRTSSQAVRPSLGFGSQDVPQFSAGMPALELLRQSLISKALNSHLYGDGLSSTETSSLSHLVHERDQIVPFNVLQGPTGISESSPLKNIPVDCSCSMLQNQYFEYSDPTSQSKIF